VARHRPRPVRHEIAFGQVEIRPAHAAHGDPDADLTRTGPRHRQLGGDQGPLGHRRRSPHPPGPHGGRGAPAHRATVAAALASRAIGNDEGDAP